MARTNISYKYSVPLGVAIASPRTQTLFNRSCAREIKEKSGFNKLEVAIGNHQILLAINTFYVEVLLFRKGLRNSAVSLIVHLVL